MGLHNQSAFKRVLMLTGSSATTASSLLNAYGGQGFAMLFSGNEPSISIKDDTTPSNNWESADGPANSVQNFFKNRSFTSYTGPVTSGKRLMQRDGYIKPCRHNLIPMSNRFGSAAWTLTAVTSTYGQTDVDGSATASLITESDTSTSALYNATAFTTAANVPYTISCKIKKGNSTWVRLAFGTSGGTFTNGVQQWYNLDTVATGTAATTGTASYISSSITATTNSYYILTLTASQASTTGAFIVSTATADASATRTTSGTYYICQAMCNSGSSVLDYVSSEAHNLALQSADVTTSWTNVGSTDSGNTDTGPDGTTTADRVIETAAGGRHCVYQAFSTAVVGLPVTYTARVKQGTRQYAFLQLSDNSLATYGVTFDLSNGAVGDVYTASSPTGTGYAVTALANGFYELSVTKTSAHASTYAVLALSDSLTPSAYTSDTPSYVGDGSSYIIVGNQQIELSSVPGKYVATTAAAVYNPHFDVPVEFNTDGTVKALTREEARTNLILHSSDMTQASGWTVSAASTNATAARNATGIDGVSNTACTLTDDSDNGAHYAQTGSVATTSGTTYTLSVYAKAGTKSWLRLAFRSVEFGSPNSGWFNLATGVVGSADAGTTISIKSAGNGWYLCSASRAATATSTSVCYIAMQTADNETTYTGDGTGTMYFDCAQFEAGSTASSPIVTGSATVTRAVDVIEFSNRVLGWSDATLSVYTKATLDSIAATQRLVAIDDGTANETHQLSIVASTGVYNSTTVDGGVTQADASTGNAATAGTAFKAATSIKVNDLAAGLNNGTLATDTSITMPTVHTVRLGAGLSAAAPSTGQFNEFMIVPTDLSDAQLGSLTT